MKTNDKIYSFYKDMFEFIEQLEYSKILQQTVASLLLMKISESFNKNFGKVEAVLKEYSKIDFSESIQKLEAEINKINKANYDYSNLPNLDLSDSLKKLNAKVINK